MRHAPVGNHFIAQRTLRPKRQFVFGGLAVDQVAATARMPGGVVSPSAVSLLAHHKQQAEVPMPLLQEPRGRANHRRDNTLGVAGAAAPDELLVLEKRNV